MARKPTRANIGENMDGTFYCGECGKSGFKSLPAVRGHFSVCEGAESISKILFPIKEVAGDGELGGGCGGGPGPLTSDDSKDDQIKKASVSKPTKENDSQLARQFRIEIAKLKSQMAHLSTVNLNHLQHIRPRNNTMGDFNHSVHSFAPHPSMRHDPMTFGFSGMPEALGFNPRQWALIKLLGFGLAAFFIWKLLSADETLARLVKKRLVRKI
jgi:hypothetical protein